MPIFIIIPHYFHFVKRNPLSFERGLKLFAVVSIEQPRVDIVYFLGDGISVHVDLVVNGDGGFHFAGRTVRVVGLPHCVVVRFGEFRQACRVRNITAEICIKLYILRLGERFSSRKAPSRAVNNIYRACLM